MLIADFAVVTPTGAPVVIVEVKGRPGASTEWATRLRRNYLAHGRWPAGAAFMLVTPDDIYYWEARAKLTRLEEPPDYVVPWRQARAAVRAEQQQTSGIRDFDSELEADVWTWLNSLIG